MPGRPSRLAATAAAALTTLVIVGATPASAAPSEFYGVNAQGLFALPDQAVDDHLDTMAAAGLQTVRRDASWDTAEPDPPDPATGTHTYRWEKFDREVTAYARHGLRWLPIVDYSTPWAGAIAGDVFSPPARLEDYAAYAAAFSRRYGTGGLFWRQHPDLPQLPVTRLEIWNEPNAKVFWHPQGEAPERYADLYMAAREAIRGVDPAARVIVGGLAVANADVLDENEFIRAMVRHRPDLAGSVDGVAYHPYTSSARGVLSKIRDFRSTLQETGIGNVPMEITEVGWTTSKTTEEERAEALRRLADELPRSDCNIGSLVPHTWLTEEKDQSNPEDWFGIYNANGTPKPSGASYLSTVRLRRLDAGSPVHHCASDQPAPTDVRALRTPGPILRLRVNRRALRRRMFRARLRCPAGCRIRVDLLAKRSGSRAAGGYRRIAQRRFRFGAERRTVRVSLSAGDALIRLRATAIDDALGRSVRDRRFAVRAARARR